MKYRFKLVIPGLERWLSSPGNCLCFLNEKDSLKEECPVAKVLSMVTRFGKIEGDKVTLTGGHRSLGFEVADSIRDLSGHGLKKATVTPIRRRVIIPACRQPKSGMTLADAAPLEPAMLEKRDENY